MCRKVAKDTGGEFGVAMTPEHLKDLALTLVPPRANEEGGVGPSRSLIRVGFPERQPAGAPTLCFGAGDGAKLSMSSGEGTYMCASSVSREPPWAPSRCRPLLDAVRLESPSPPRVKEAGTRLTHLRARPGRRSCPQCDARHLEIPTQCPLCDIRLISSAELTKTYHHLFPVPTFVEARTPLGHSQRSHRGVTAAGADAPLTPADGEEATASPAAVTVCFGCREALPVSMHDGVEVVVSFQCPASREHFCASCDDLVHETLHTCPGCESRAQPHTGMLSGDEVKREV